MTRDIEIATFLRTDATLLALVTGGVYAWNEIGGFDGFRRGTGSPTANAFDANGFLKPCLMVKMRAPVPFGEIRDLKAKKASASQVAELYYYQDRAGGDTAITPAKERGYILMEGKAFVGAYPARWVLETDPVPDSGPLAGATTVRQDFQIVEVRG